MFSVKRLVSILLAIIMCFSVAACSYTPPETPGGGDHNDNTDIPGGEEQHFETALEAYEFGEKYFNEEAPFYETVQYGTAIALGIKTYVLTKRYKSDVSNNFLYETATIGEKISGIDPVFVLKSYRDDDSDKIYYGRIDGAGREAEGGAAQNPAYSTPSFRGGTADFNGLALQEKADWAEYKRDVGGNIPQNLTVYKINASTIKSVLSFEKNVEGYAYLFKLSLNEGAVVDYVNQVSLYSKQAYTKFNTMGFENGLTAEFGMDKYGRILRMRVEENYRVSTVSAAVGVINTSTEYYSYGKRPVIDFVGEGVFTEPAVTYAALPGNSGAQEYTVSFNPHGGSTVSDIKVMQNSEIGALPLTEQEGYEFGGWYSMPNGEGTPYVATTLFTATTNITLHAYWYTVDATGLGTFAPINGGNSYKIITGVVDSAEFSVPLTYSGKPITAIGVNAYKGNTTITSLTIHKGITQIDEGAFYNCTNLVTLEFEEGSALKTIGKQAFYGNRKAAGKLEIPKTVEEIGEGAFHYNEKFTHLIFEEGSALRAIGKDAFRECKGLIGDDLYDENGDPVTIEITVIVPGQPPAKEEIQIQDGITLPAALEYIGESAFEGCSYLYFVNFEGENLIQIGKFAFKACERLRKIDVPSSVIEIVEGAFYSCKSLMEFNYSGENLRLLDKDVFNGCTALTSFDVPASLTEIGEGAFRACTAMTEVNFADNGSLIVVGASAFTNTKIAQIVIPNTIKIIGASAFTTGSATTSITFEENSSLEVIGQAAFKGLTNAAFTSLEIPASVKEIGIEAFSGCTMLTSVTFEQGSQLEKIGERAFFGCTAAAFNSIEIPATVTEIGAGAFGNVALTSIEFKSEDNFVVENGIVYTADYTRVCFGLKGAITSETTLRTTVEVIDAYAFYGATGLVITGLPTAVTEIGAYTFWGCTGIETLSLENVDVIGTNAFQGCKNLASVTLGSGLTEIANDTFYDCSKLNNVVIPEGVTRLGNNAFRDCSKLLSIMLPSTLETIGNNTFRRCSVLGIIILPSSLKSIGSSVFTDCTLLKTIVVLRSVQNGITTIGSGSLPNTVANIYVAPDSVEAYKAATNWKGAAAKISSIIDLIPQAEA